MALRHVALMRSAVALLVPISGMAATQQFVLAAHSSRVPHAASGAVARVESDLRRLAITEETFFTDNVTYGSNAQMRAAGYSSSRGSTVHVAWFDAAGYCLTGHRTGAAGSRRSYDSLRGGLQAAGFRCAAVQPADAHHG